uniref:IU_nuc_hydro domain-containing protein n=1 Tax=Caenorhabditis tropicalis TaxID=1561998 RepID=A0A1I7TTF8_9PELO
MISHIIQSCFLISFVLSTSQSTVKLIIDTDGVYDDIRGLTIALTYPNVEVLAITTVHGGVTANQSAANVVRLLRAVGKESIPIFIGAQDSMIPKGKIEVWEELFGYDGIGGVPDANPKALPSDFKSAQKMHAVDAIIQFTRNTSDVVLVGLGPLTNIAMALQKDADLANRIRKVVIMGGNYLGIGNTQYNSTAEFNFLMDPEAAQIVLSSIHTTIVPWDTCFLKGPVYNEEVDYEESLHQNTNLSYFLSNITLKAREFNTIAQQIYAFVDDIAISIAIDPEILKKSVELYASVELEREAKTRGQVTIDWLGTKYDPIDQQFKAATNKNVSY